jgi:hypothetical protein
MEGATLTIDSKGRAPKARRLTGVLGALAMLGSVLVSALAISEGTSLAGTPAVLTPSPASLQFGDVRVGTLALDDTTKVTFTNSGGTDLTIGSVTNEGDQTNDFAGLTGINPTTFDNDPAYDCLKESDGVTPRVLSPAESCVFFILAYPTGFGVRSTTMTVRDSVDNVLTEVTLSANGTEGYYVAGQEGDVAKFGDAADYGDATDLDLNGPIVDIAQVPFGEGYWLLGLDGGVFAYGPNAAPLGSMGGTALNAPVIAMSARSADGYYLTALDGGVFNFGEEAPFHGSMGGKPLNAPVVGIAVDPLNDGYLLVAADGGVFAFGNAHFAGSMGGKPLNAPVVGIVADPDGVGYWLVAADGGVFAFDAPFVGSYGGTNLNSPMIDIAPSPTGGGYWLLALDGGVFALGDAEYLGNTLVPDTASAIAGTAPPTDPAGLGGFYVSVNDQTLVARQRVAQASRYRTSIQRSAATGRRQRARL